MQLKGKAMNKNFLKNFEQYVNDISNDKFLELVNQTENLPWEYKLPNKNRRFIISEHIPYSHAELIDLFSDCINKKRFVDKTVNGNKIKTWGGVNNGEGFNLYNFYRPRIFFTEPAKCMERPDIILFYQSGISAVIEVKTSRNDFLADFKKKHIKNNNGMGDYKYLLCSKDIDIKELPDTWGILRIEDIGKYKPYLYMERMALKMNKNSYEEIELLSKLLKYSKTN